MNEIKREVRLYMEDDDGGRYGEIILEELDGGLYDITHTLVEQRMAGKGIAGKLVEAAVLYVYEKGGKVKATCSYAQHWLEKNK